MLVRILLHQFSEKPLLLKDDQILSSTLICYHLGLPLPKILSNWFSHNPFIHIFCFSYFSFTDSTMAFGYKSPFILICRVEFSLSPLLQTTTVVAPPEKSLPFHF